MATTKISKLFGIPVSSIITFRLYPSKISSSSNFPQIFTNDFT